MTTEPALVAAARFASRTVRTWDAIHGDDEWASVEGTFGFVDVSGFTRMSERFARASRTGAEDVNGVLNGIFGRLVDVVLDWGGDVLQFGGDALALWFAGDGHAERGAACMLDLQQALRSHGSITVPGGRVRLTMSAGIETGTAVLGRVGRTHSDLVAIGPLITEVLRLEGAASGGMVRIGARLAATIGESCWRRPPGDAEATVLRRRPRASRPTREARETTGSRPLLDPQLDAVVTTSGFHGEHRTVAVAFVTVSGLDELVQVDPADAMAVVSRVAGAIDHVVESAGVCWSACDVTANGATFLLFTGAPVARGDDQERLLRACLSIVDVCSTLDVHIGVNTGPAFVGAVGPSARRTLAIIGDTVNLAARLKGLAGSGEVVASQATLDASRVAFVVDERAPVKVKGKSAPVAYAAVRGVASSRRLHAGHELPLVGREALVAHLVGGLLGERSAQEQLIDLVADAGAGKSRVADEVLRRVGESGAVLVRGAADPYERAVPFHPLIEQLRTLASVGPGSAADEARLAAQRWVAGHLADGESLFPLVAPVFGLDSPDTAATRSIAADHRAARQRDAITDLLGSLADRVVIAIEDVHWADDSTRDLVAHIAEWGGPFSVLVTRRPGGAGIGVEPVLLEPLDRPALDDLARYVRGDAAIPDHELTRLVERADGNPLFLRELVLAAGAGLSTTAANVESVIASRLDTLPAASRLLLRDASVAGRECDVSLLAEVLEDADVVRLDVWDAAADFVDVTVVGGQVSAIAFRHDLHRAVAYDGAAVARRREIHRRLATAIEVRHAADPDAVAAVLAAHRHAAQDWSPALEWALVAARRSEAIGSWSDAWVAWSQASDAARHQDLSDDERVQILVSCGDAAERSARFADADAAYVAARRVRRGDRSETDRLDVRRAVVAVRHGSFDTTMRLAARALRPDADDVVVVRGRMARGLARAQQGRFRDAERELAPCLEIARRSGDRELLAHLLGEMELVASALDRPESREFAREAAELLADLGDDVRLAHVLSNSAFTYFAHGDWTEATRQLDRAVEALMRCGDNNGAGFAANNQAEILVEQGRYAEATALFESASRLLRACHNAFGEPNIHSGLGRVAVRSGRLEDGRRLLEAARGGYASLGASAFVLDTDVRLAELLTHEGRPKEAIEVLAGIAGDVDESGDVLMALAADRQRAVALGMLADPVASAVLDSVMSRAREIDAPFDELCCAEIRRVWSGLATLPDDMGQRRRSMGIVALPPVPLGGDSAASTLQR